MTDLPPSDNSGVKAPVTPLRCLLGASISGALAWGLYGLTAAIAVSFATKPILSDNLFVQRIGAAVRTLVLGVASLGTFIFGFVAVGLILLATQLLWQQLFPKAPPEA
ncbi:DUF3082 domain-containing protein [Synechocystis sp. LKSZ1]|uniref:DUF3082 domain-containing protein n=1 Tax=Synechocystis sp. LKSZ1 TaxID=3144951 RepID=UPI00336C22A0